MTGIQWLGHNIEKCLQKILASKYDAEESQSGCQKVNMTLEGGK